MFVWDKKGIDAIMHHIHRRLCLEMARVGETFEDLMFTHHTRKHQYL